jgi:hypothetical protein
MHPRSGRIKGWVRAPASSFPSVAATRLWGSSTGRGTEDICEPSRSTPGIISESGSRRSVKGSTLRRWMAATTPAAVSPHLAAPARPPEGAGDSSVSRAGPRSASWCRRWSPLVEKTMGASHRRSEGKTTGAATPCLKRQGWRGYTVAHAPASTGGCNHRPAPPCELSSPPSPRQKAPQRRDGSTDPSGGQSPKTLRKPPRRWLLARWSWG